MQLGKHSPKLSQLRKAIWRGTLTDEGLLPIEGPILLEEAHRSRIDRVARAVRASSDLFKTIQETEHSQGIVATVRPPQFSLEQILNSSSPLIVVLCRLQDPGNVGTILRIGEAFGATACIALRGRQSRSRHSPR